MNDAGSASVVVRRTEERDFDGIIVVTREVYPFVLPYAREQLASQRGRFPEGQLVAVDAASDEVLGMAASLIVRWDDYGHELDWHDFTDSGYFRNHDPSGRTLYGAEVMVRPGLQGRGIGKALYAARRELVEALGLLRIRAGARLRGYAAFAESLSAEAYVRAVVRGEIRDPTLTFQLRQGFRVIATVSGYLRTDPESLGHAAVIEWLNPKVATEADFARQAASFPT